MKGIWKFGITLTNDFTQTLPKGAKIIHVGVQKNLPFFWVEVDIEAEKETVAFSLKTTGEAFNDKLVEFVGTFIIDDPAHPTGTFVGHLYRSKQMKPIDKYKNYKKKKELFYLEVEVFQLQLTSIGKQILVLDEMAKQLKAKILTKLGEIQKLSEDYEQMLYDTGAFEEAT